MTAVTGPTFNGQDFFPGARAKLEVSPWVTNAGAGSFGEAGSLRGVTLNMERQWKQIDADNATFALGAYYFHSNFSITAELLEASLTFLAYAMNDLGTAVIDTGTAPAITSRAYPLGEPTNTNFWQIRLSATGQSMNPMISGAHITNPLVSRVVTLWRCYWAANIKQAYKVGTETVIPVVIHAMLDTSITSPAAGNGQVGQIIDATT